VTKFCFCNKLQQKRAFNMKLCIPGWTLCDVAALFVIAILCDMHVSIFALKQIFPCKFMCSPEHTSVLPEQRCDPLGIVGMKWENLVLES
jgi:hypothetical protein